MEGVNTCQAFRMMPETWRALCDLTAGTRGQSRARKGAAQPAQVKHKLSVGDLEFML